MHNFASLWARGMPSVPIQHITSTNADIPTSSSGAQSTTRLTSRRLIPPPSVRQHLSLANDQLIEGAGDCIVEHSSNANLALWHSQAFQKVEEHVYNPQFMPCLPGSPNYEHDLATMVQDYMENGSHGSDFYDSSDGAPSILTDSKPFETLGILVSNKTVFEEDLSSAITAIILSLSDKDLPCFADASRKCGGEGGCIRRMLVKHLQLLKYNAAVCSSEWSSMGKMPSGEHEYIDVIIDSGCGKSTNRVIVDVDFRSQFEIARPTPSYLAALSCLPVLFIGSVEKLSRALQVMASAAKASLKQNCMPVPPWRSLAYMKAKWLSPCKRLADESLSSYKKVNVHMRPTGQCIQELQFLKGSLSSGAFVQGT